MPLPKLCPDVKTADEALSFVDQYERLSANGAVPHPGSNTLARAAMVLAKELRAERKANRGPGPCEYERDGFGGFEVR